MKARCYLILVVVIISVLVFSDGVVSASNKPMTIAELALYKGADRQQILEEGAKKEGILNMYTTFTASKVIVSAFQKKYPYIKVQRWRSDTSKVISKILEEYKVGRHVVDVTGFTQAGEVVMEEYGNLQPFYSPNLTDIEEGSIRRAPDGNAFAAGVYQSGISLGYNTKLITREELPKTHQDLLDPKWKGKMPIVTSTTGVCWVGGLFEKYGEEFVKKLVKQSFVTHSVSGRALCTLLVNGEYELSPTILDSHVRSSKKKGAPIDWIPLEPVTSYLGRTMLPKYAAHPHAAMLYIDFTLSQQGGELWKANGYNSPRKDVPGERRYKKYYGPQSAKQLQQWSSLFNKLFMKK